MALADDAMWEAGEWQVERFNIAPQPVQQSKVASAGTKLMGLFGGAAKASTLCQVDECDVDVSRMKDYHSRYKICEAHLKAKSAIKDGIQQRFCQQCGKFHPVEDFDGDKRSCRARLDKHNARRRRMREMQHMLRTTGTVDEAALQAKYGLSEEELAPKVKKLQASMSKSVRKSNNGVHTPTGSMGHGSQSGNSSAGNLPGLDLSGLPGITQADLDLLGDDFLEDVLGPIPGMPQNAAGAAASFLAIDPASIMDLDDMAVLEELTREFGIDANAAALSAAQGGHALLGGKPHVAVPSTPSAAAGAFPAHSAPVSIHMPPGGHQGYPYVTQQQAALLAGMSQQRFSGPGGARGQFPFMPGQSPAGPSNTVTTGAAPTSLPPYMMQGMPQASNVSNPVAVRSSTNSVNFNGTDQPTVMEEALNLLAYDRSQVAYAAQEKLVRCSTKLFGCTPADLPPDLKASLMDMLVVEGMEGFMRPGCVHLEIDALVGPEEQAVLADGGMRAAIERYLAADTSGASAERTIVFQIGDKMALVVNGELKHVVCTAGAGSLLPSLEAVRPMALPAPAGRNAEVIVALWGNNLREEDTVLARSKGRHLEAEIVAITSEAAWNGLQRAEIRVRGAFSPGALQLEVMRGAYVSSAKAALVCTTAEEALEVRSLEATLNPGDADTLVYELGSLVEAAAMAAARRGSPAAAAQALAAAPAPPGKAARRLLPFLVQRKWPLMMRKALDAAIADMPVGEAMGEADVVAAGTTGMPLLQLAVRAQCAEVLSMLLQWARANRHEFKSTTPGRRGLTALHLAALVQDGGLTASLLTAACPDALHGWDGARAEDGSTPLALATRFGTRNTIERIIAEAQYAKLGSFGVVATKSFAEQPMREGPSSSDAVSGKKGITLHRFPSEYDDMALSKAATKSAALATEAAMGPLLTFASPKLEAKFKQWHNAGQVPVDLAFMLIAILSQAAWVARWSMSESLVLGMSMVALMSFNCVYMALATLRPKAYVARREGLCVASLLVHKVVQMLVTVMPGVGTIYSPTYNTTVALLESSSFAQVAMLSFGAKARLVTHVPTLLVLLGLSSLSNGAICSAAWPSLAVGLCTPALFAFQASACWALPCAAVYLAEKRSRRIFLETAVA